MKVLCNNLVLEAFLKDFLFLKVSYLYPSFGNHSHSDDLLQL